MTVHLLELIERSETGEAMPKSEWDFEHIVLPTAGLVRKYNLTWDPEHILPEDPDLADRVYQAGLELALQSGIYSVTTGRVIRFDPAEIQAGIREMPVVLSMGEGKDMRSLYARQVCDTRLPLVWAGNPGVPTPQGLFLPMVMSWMQEPIVDLVTCGSLIQIDGYSVHTGEASEILATRKELSLMREGLHRVGRPGMGMLAAQSSVSALGDLSVAHPDYLRPCDAHLVPLLNELAIDHGSLSRAANSLDYGMRNASLACVMVGGLGGDAPGAAVVQVASFLLANLVCQADYHLLHPIHIRHVATSTPAVMWLQSVVEQAFARNAPCIIVSDIYPKSGAMTKELLYETAANAIAVTVSGGHLEGVGAANGAAPNCSGLEARWMGEVGHAVNRQGLGLDEANALILKLAEKYRHVFTKTGGNPGVPFDQAYDMKTLTPRPEWDEMYRQVKAELVQMGLQT